MLKTDKIHLKQAKFQETDFRASGEDVAPTRAGDVDGPLKVLLPEDNARRPGLGLRIGLSPALHPNRGGDEVALLGPDGQEERGRVSNIQGRVGTLR